MCDVQWQNGIYKKWNVNVVSWCVILKVCVTTWFCIPVYGASQESECSNLKQN